MTVMTELPLSLTERRTDHRLREFFDQASMLIEPFFDPANSWSGQTLELLAFRVMRENFPQISREETLAFVSAAKIIFARRRTNP